MRRRNEVQCVRSQLPPEKRDRDGVKMPGVDVGTIFVRYTSEITTQNEKRMYPCTFRDA